MPNTENPLGSGPTEPPDSPPVSPATWMTDLPAGMSWYSSRPAPGGDFAYLQLSNSITAQSPTAFAAQWAALREWCELNHMRAQYYSAQRVSTTDGIRVRVPHIVIVYSTSYQFDLNANAVEFVTPMVCWNCDDELDEASLLCPGCMALQTCSRHGEWRNRLYMGSDGSGICSDCSFICEEPGCEQRSGFPICLDHAEGDQYNCMNCGDYTDDGMGAEFSEYSGGVVCESCVPGICDECERETTELANGLCSRCYERAHLREERQSQGTEEYEEAEKGLDDLFVHSIPGRENIRMCGLEIEGAGNYTPLLRALSAAGLTRTSHIQGYHASTNERETRFWSLEQDSSVDWELVSPPINLAERSHIQGLRTALGLIRDEIRAESVSFDMRCGLHIHVGAERTAIGGAFNLGTVWGFLEDVIFRLGAARWPKHRAIVNGVHYCQPTQKGAKTRLEFGLQIENQDEARYRALSFNNYIRAMSRGCQCGAVRYDSWDQCVCDLGKCTFEFRVFNTSANMHKIHAYLALCQALVAYATNRADLDLTAFPAQEFIPQMVEDMGGVVREVHTENWKPRLEFLFNELPLTDPEKADLLYCVRSSELSVLGEEFIGTLAPTNAQEVLV